MTLQIGMAVAVFFAGTIGAWALLGATVSERVRVRRRLQRMAEGRRGAVRVGAGERPAAGGRAARGDSADGLEDGVQRRAGGGADRRWERLVAPLARRFESFAERRFTSGDGRRPDLDVRLQRAGLHLKAAEFQAVRLIAVVVAGLAGLFLLGGAIGAIVGCSAGWLAPTVYLGRRGSKRLQALNGQIGDALIMISNSLKAGYSFLQAMELVSSEMAPPLSEAFALALTEMNVGAETDDALQAMADRSGSDDLSLVVTGVLIQRQVGGNLAEVLDNIALTIRERVRIQGEIKALTAQGRISGLVIGALPVGLFLILLLINPGYVMSMVQHPLGRVMLGLGVAGELIGAFFIRKIVRIEV